MFDLAGQLDIEMRAFAAGGAGTVRFVASTSAIGGHNLPETLADFEKNHPGVVVELREKTSIPILQDVFDGRADLGLITSNISIPGGVEASAWRKDRLAAITSADGPLLRKKQASFNEILNCLHIEVMEFSSVTLTWQVLLKNSAESLRVESMSPLPMPPVG